MPQQDMISTMLILIIVSFHVVLKHTVKLLLSLLGLMYKTINGMLGQAVLTLIE
jgi:hypothetical protein